MKNAKPRRFSGAGPAAKRLRSFFFQEVVDGCGQSGIAAKEREAPVNAPDQTRQERDERAKAQEASDPARRRLTASNHILVPIPQKEAGVSQIESDASRPIPTPLVTRAPGKTRSDVIGQKPSRLR